MARFTAFTFTALESSELWRVCNRHFGARRFAYNTCLDHVEKIRRLEGADPSVKAPRTGFDLVNFFNTWKLTQAAGQTFVVRTNGEIEVLPGLFWRGEVCAQVFEEAAIDLGRALEAHKKSRRGERKGPPVGFPTRKKKGGSPQSFRIRNKASKRGRQAIRLGEEGARSITLPVIGTIRLREDTRRLRRLLRPDENGNRSARILFATVRVRRGRIVVIVTVEASELHPQRRHQERPGEKPDFVGIDRGLCAYVVAARADGTPLNRTQGPRPLARVLPQLRSLDQSVSRKKEGSKNRRKALAKRRLLYARIADQRRDFLHKLSSELVKTHDELCIEDLAVANLMKNRHLARHIGDASWSTFSSMLSYKASWFHTELQVAPRRFPSTKTCSSCGWVSKGMTVSDRVFSCRRCGGNIDRDLNAAINLAKWANGDFVNPGPRSDRPGQQCLSRDGISHRLGGGKARLAIPRTRGRKQEPNQAEQDCA